MIYTFRVLSTRAAKVRMGLRTNDIIKELITEAEKLELGTNDYAIYKHHELELKIVVQFTKKEIHVMTPGEYVEAGFPGRPERST